MLISFLVYVSDIFTAVTMLTTTSWSNAIFNSCPQDQSNGCVYIPFSIGRWLLFGCVIFSFLLLAYEAYKAKRIIQSRDISYAFTNVMANNYYSLRKNSAVVGRFSALIFLSQDHTTISVSSTTLPPPRRGWTTSRSSSSSPSRVSIVERGACLMKLTSVTGWKRLLFADGPRQAINALTLYAFYLSKEDDGDWYDIKKYFNGDLITSALVVSTTFTVLVFALSMLMLIIAGICYIPLLCHIQGNLKEYCCHKVDKVCTIMP